MLIYFRRALKFVEMSRNALMYTYAGHFRGGEAAKALT
jgi:hypothetical protein